MESWHLTQATSHYHADRFKQAAISFSESFQEDYSTKRGPSSSKKRPRPTPRCDELQMLSQTIFAAVPRASILADKALCHFRSSMSHHATQFSPTHLEKDRDTSDVVELLMEAREANRAYRLVLEGVVSSLRREASEVYKKKENAQFFYAVSRYRMQTALAVLMAGVSASWLYLVHRQPTEQQSPYDEIDERKARSVLQQMICLAASCFLPHDKNDSMILSWEEGLETVRNLLSNGNEQRYSDRVMFDVNERQRIKYVLKTVENAICVINLSIGDDRVSREVNKDKLSNKKSENLKEFGDDPKLFVQATLSKALWHHVRISMKLNLRGASESAEIQSDINHEEQRNEYLGKALTVDSTGLSKKVQLLLQGHELLLSERQPDNFNDTIKYRRRREVLSALEKLASTSRIASEMLGCLHCQNGCFDKGLSFFQMALTMDEKLGAIGANTNRVTVSNIAQCFVMLGKPAAAVKHLKDLLSSKAISKVVQEGTVVPCFQDLTSNKNTDGISLNQSPLHKISLLWRLFQASTLVDNWDLCVKSAEEIKSLEDEDDMNASLAIIFSLLQNERSMECAKYDKTSSRVLVSTAMDLYMADAKLTMGVRSEDIQGMKFNEMILMARNMTKRAVDNIKELRIQMPLSRQLREIQACAWNNYGVALSMEGEIISAMCCFQEACKLLLVHLKKVKATGKLTNDGKVLAVHSLFNLAILLVKEGFYSEAAGIWLNLRGFESESVKENLETSIKRFVQERKRTDFRVDYIQPWEKSNDEKENYGSIAIAECIALDIILLKKQIGC